MQESRIDVSKSREAKMFMSMYQEDHNDEVSLFDKMVSEHERVSGHDPKSDKWMCDTCVVIFNMMVEDGQYCRFHPESYFEPATKDKAALCEACNMEETI
jgi:hypothetical protein